MKSIKVNKSNLVSPMDIQVVPWDYVAQQGEHVYIAYIGGEIPIRLMSKTISYEDFCQIC